MTLDYSTGSCSLVPDILLHEAGARFERAKVDLQKKITETGANHREVNPKGSVPKWPVLVAYKNRIAARPAVHAAMVAQGILKS